MPGTADGKKNKSGVRKMKIAVVTVYDGLNYGSFLQAYAMQAFLKECGHEVYFVQRLTEEENLALFTTRRPQEDCGVVRRLWRKILSCTVNREKIQRQTRYYTSQFPYYQEDWKHFRLISPEEAGGMDCIVCGSDEIWNLNNLNLDVPFYACAGYGDGIPKLAVAVSAGNASRDDFRKYPQLEKAIGEFAKFLVRDRHTEELVREITGAETEFVRPPFGAFPEDMEEELDKLYVKWTVDPLDWTTENADEIVQRVVTETKENDIILLHDCYESSVEAALRIIDILQEEGYEFVTVDRLLID